MTWKRFQDDSFRLTEGDVQKHVPYIISQYKQAIKDINKDLAKLYLKLSGAASEDYYTEALKYNRLNDLLKQVTKSYNEYSRKAGQRTVRTGAISAANNYYRMSYTHQWLVDISFSVLPDTLIEMTVLNTDKAWSRYQKELKKIYGPGQKYIPQYGTLSEILSSNRVKEIDQIHRAITQGLIRGESYTKTARAVKEVIGTTIKKDGVVQTTGAMANAVRVVRTESNRIMNQMSTANTEYARSEGVEVRRVWNAALDNRTRPVHAALDNKQENKNGLFESSAGFTPGPGQFSSVGQNVNCRCTTFESVNGSRPTLRRGRNPVTGENEVFSYKDFDKWAKDNDLKQNKFGQYVPGK